MKRQTQTQKSLLSFFKKSNSNNATADASTASTAASVVVDDAQAQALHHDQDDDEDSFVKPHPKRLKSSAALALIDSDEDDDDDQHQHQHQQENKTSTPSLKEFQHSKYKYTPTAATPRNTTATPRSTLGSFFNSTPNTAATATPASAINIQSRAEKFKEKNEERYSWLLDLKDENGNLKGHPDYDPRTLLIPKSAWNKFTPFEKQFWEIKSKHYDTVVFFKKGKFFELYENDADIGHQQFDLKLTDRVNMRMVGVPESSFHHWASQFIARGFKVAKVEQMENAIGKAIRGKQAAQKEDKIIRRELTSVLTTGTLVDGEFLTSDQSCYLMAIKEEQPNPQLPPLFGVAFVDTATAEFNISFFTDDLSRTKFETLITQTRPKELVIEKGMLTRASTKILKTNLDNSQFNYLTPGLEFWGPEQALEELKSGEYFAAPGHGEMDTDGQGADGWPEAVKEAISHPLALTAFGGLVSYLRSLKLDKSLISASNIHIYDPVKSTSSLILDGQTLMNLEIFTNSIDGSDKGSLFNLINHCTTPFGKRMFHRWVCHPLRSVSEINARLDAVDDFTAHAGVLEDVKSQMSKLPDLERIIARIHAGNCLVRDFVGCLDAFDKVRDLFANLATYADRFMSAKLKNILCHAWPDELVESIEYFTQAFNHKEAASKGHIQFNEGFEADFDQLCKNVQIVEDKLESYRRDQSRTLNVTISFRDIGKEVYQLEINKSDSKKVPREWVEVSKTQAVSRWYSERLRALVAELLEAKEMLEGGMRDAKMRLYKAFDEHYHLWMKSIGNLAEIDCLMGLAFCKKVMSEPMCRPEFIEDGSESVLELEEMRHPCVFESLTSEYIPNDLVLTGSKDSMVLLTGPNMGGKSTLLRQTCIAVIMAQLGCYVPATKCRLTPFDRIFTRIGANDNIMAGQSTFMVELTETSKILKEATDRSLVILDELGRGTSTFDGYAIAFAVLYHLVSKVGCLGLFSTHYGTLTNEFESHPLVALKYMDFLVEEESQQVTFLYKLADGKCPQSYGMNVARMARIPESIIENAQAMARDFDENHSFKTAGEGVLANLLTLANFNSLVNCNVNQEGTMKRVFQSLFE